MSAFDALDRLASAAVDRVFSDGFTVHPQKATPNGPSVTDPDRESWTGFGILIRRTGPMNVDEGARNGAGNALITRMSGATWELSIDRYANPKASEIERGDHVSLADGTCLLVGMVRPDGLARIVIELS